MAKTGAVAVKGQRELVAAFNKINRDLGTDLIQELEEVGQPVAKLSTQYILGGGGGFPAMRGIAQGRDASYWSSMRVGASRSTGTVWVAPAWSSNKGTLQGAILAVQFRFRMEAALEDKSDDVEKRLGNFLDDLGREWERYG